ncbi:MAG: hypothetical protein AAGG44_13520 [Planctomycetota bacterium]
MATVGLDRSRLEVKLGSYAVGPATILGDTSAQSAAQDYRRAVAGRMMPIGKADIRAKVPKADYFASRKIDGEFTLLVFDGEDVFSINPGGTVRVGLPWMDEAKKLLQAAGVGSARIAGELFIHNDSRRPRVHDVTKIARGPKSEEELSRIRFAPFDIVEWDGEQPADEFAATRQTLENTFGGGQLNVPVETVLVNSPSEIERLFAQWVEDEDAEGIVLRSDEAGVFKLKPRHTIDAVVVGFTESTDEREGMLHDLLVAVTRSDGSFHVLTKVGGGFSEDDRRAMLSDLKDLVVESEYAEVNSDYVAYKMVRPEWVVEISCLDMISQTTRGGDVNRMVIDFDASSEEYKVVRRMPLASIISPQFVRRRDDKEPQFEDTPIGQISSRVEVAKANQDAKSFTLPKTEVLKREVFTKVLKGETMVRKFVMLRTNKSEAGGEFPAFVLHYTDFSPNRKDPLQREVLVSNSEEQIHALFVAMREKNIKKGWNEHA